MKKNTTTQHATHHTAPSKRATKPTPEDQNQDDRLVTLVKEVREAFSRNGFDTPGDIDLQIRSMANLMPHRELPAEQRIGPGVAAQAA